jgi:ribulokinase
MDFGTLSGRAVAVEIGTGRELASAVWPYTHAVMDETLWDGQKLPPDWALQYPRDYIEAMEKTIPQVIRESGIDAQDVIGIGIDFTACTILPAKKDGTALCELPEFKHNPHAYVKLWKHHAAQEHANRLNEIAQKRGEDFLPRYGGKISSEWLVPKVMQIVEEAPEVYDAADRIIEAADWVVWQLTGKETRNSCTAGYKAIWHKKKGYPGKEFFKALHPKLENLVADKLSTVISPLGLKAGEVTVQASHWCGLNPGTAVAVANVDAHVCLPAVGIDGPGKLLAIMGTSTCHIMLGDKEREVPGMCGVVEDGVMPGYFGYEAGQSCVGDHFAWFMDRCCPEEYVKAAKEKGMDIHAYLTEKAQALTATLKDWDTKNKEKIDKLVADQKAARQAKDKAALKQISADLATARSERVALEKAGRKEIMDLLTPEQQQAWTLYQLQNSVLKQFARAKLTDEQVAKIKDLCVAAQQEMAAVPADDAKGHAKVKAKLIKSVQEQVLTDAQREAMKAAPKNKAADKPK